MSNPILKHTLTLRPPWSLVHRVMAKPWGLNHMVYFIYVENVCIPLIHIKPVSWCLLHFYSFVRIITFSGSPVHEYKINGAPRNGPQPPLVQGHGMDQQITGGSELSTWRGPRRNGYFILLFV